MGHSLPLFFTVVTALCLALVFFALWRSLRALFGAPSAVVEETASPASDRQALLIEKQSLLQSLRDLEQERDMGKVSQDDFDAMNNRLRARAREVLKQLDAQVAPFRAQAETFVAKVAGAQAAKTTPTEAVDETASAGPAVAEGACPKCGTRNESDAVFCKKCGHKLVEGAQPS